MVEKIDDTNDIVHHVFRSEKGDAIDFSLLRSWRLWTDTDPQYVVSSCSVTHNKIPDMSPKYGRGEVLSSGFIIRAHPATTAAIPSEGEAASPHNPGCCVTYVLQLGSKALKLVVEEVAGQSKHAFQSLRKFVAVLEGYH